MKPASKFFFDRDFGETAEDRGTRAEPTPPSYSEEELTMARESAYREGVEAGLKQGLQSWEATLAQAVERAAERLSALGAQHAEQVAGLRGEAARVAYLIASKLASSVVRSRPEREVVALIEQCLPDLCDEPRLVVKCAESACEGVREKVGTIVERSGFRGDITVVADPGMQGTDCRIEWAGGGVERDQSEILARIGEAVSRFARFEDEKTRGGSAETNTQRAPEGVAGE